MHVRGEERPLHPVGRHASDPETSVQREDVAQQRAHGGVVVDDQDHGPLCHIQNMASARPRGNSPKWLKNG
jgi:hypothetical protein